MSEIWEAVQSSLLQIMVIVVTAIIGILASYATHYISKVSESLQERVNVDIGNSMIRRVEHMATSVVGSLEQNVAGELREAVKNGSAYKSELVALGSRAVEQVKRELGEEALDVLEATTGDVEAFIRDNVENAVRRIKSAEG